MTCSTTGVSDRSSGSQKEAFQYKFWITRLGIIASKKHSVGSTCCQFSILAFLDWNSRNNFAQEECHVLIKEQIFCSFPKRAPPLLKQQHATPKCVGPRLMQWISTSPSSSALPSTSQLPLFPFFCREIARSARSPASCESFPVFSRQSRKRSRERNKATQKKGTVLLKLPVNPPYLRGIAEIWSEVFARPLYQTFI